MTTQQTSLVGPWGHDYGAVARVLECFRGERILFVPNRGNGGDTLITLGATTLLDRLGLEYETGDHRADCRGRVVVYSGGGNLVAPYRNLRKFIARTEPTAAAFVILPHTVRAWPETLAAMGPQSVVFAREAPSLAYLQAHLTRAGAELSHDMAFLLDPAQFGALRPPLVGYLDQVRLRRQLVRAVRLGQMALARLRDRGAPLRAFRTDIEARKGRTLPAVNFDLSQMFAADDMSAWSCAVTARALAAAIAPYATVETDRLHVAILATLMGRQVRMFDNAYGKNRDIFLHSLQGYFGNVRLQAEAADQAG